MKVEITVPQTGGNDQYAILIEWYVEDAQKVTKGDMLCTLETTKAVFDLEAEQSGYVRLLVDAGNRVSVQSAIGWIVDDLDEGNLDSAQENKLVGDDVKATMKAIALAEKYGVDIAAIGKTGIIKEKDIREYYRQTTIREDTEEKISVPEMREGKVDERFIEFLESDSKHFGALDSDFKIFLYRQNGAKIGDNVGIGAGSVIVSSYIDIKDNAQIGEDVYVKTEMFQLGKMSIIGDKAKIVTRKVIIGDVFFSGDGILVGGGGAFGKDSGLKIGNNCLVSSKCILNTGCPIIIGDEVGLSPNVQLFTHNHWQNILEGYKANFGPVIIEDKAYVTGNCMIVPNVKIGKGATVLANSLVTEDVDAFVAVCGVPAKRLYRIQHGMPLEQKEKTIKRILPDLFEELQFKGFDANEVVFLREYDGSADQTLCSIIITFSTKKKNDNERNNVAIFDLGDYKFSGKRTEMTDEVRNFFRKRGIRFSPIYWRYEADKGFYVQ